VQEEPPSADLTELDAVRAEAKENYDKYLRAAAELENFKKRTVKERAELIRYAGEQLALDVLEIVDNLERALAQQGAQTSSDELLQGVRLIYDHFLAVLEKHAVKAQDAIGKEFDPSQHEALATVPTAEHAPNTVIEQYRRAFFFKDKLLRPAQVVVAAAIPVEGGQEAGAGGEGAGELEPAPDAADGEK
jgi:molecular chaperone GrpE